MSNHTRTHRLATVLGAPVFGPSGIFSGDELTAVKRYFSTPSDLIAAYSVAYGLTNAGSTVVNCNLTDMRGSVGFGPTLAPPVDNTNNPGITGSGTSLALTNGLRGVATNLQAPSSATFATSSGTERTLALIVGGAIGGGGVNRFWFGVNNGSIATSGVGLGEQTANANLVSYAGSGFTVGTLNPPNSNLRLVIVYITTANKVGIVWPTTADPGVTGFTASAGNKGFSLFQLLNGTTQAASSNIMRFAAALYTARAPSAADLAFYQTWAVKYHGVVLQ